MTHTPAKTESNMLTGFHLFHFLLNLQCGVMKNCTIPNNTDARAAVRAMCPERQCGTRWRTSSSGGQTDRRSFNSPFLSINVFFVIIAAKTRQTKILGNVMMWYSYHPLQSSVMLNSETDFFCVATPTRHCRRVYCFCQHRGHGTRGASTTCERKDHSHFLSPSRFGQVCETHALQWLRHAWNVPTMPCALPACRLVLLLEVPEVEATASGPALVATGLSVGWEASVTWRVCATVCSLLPSIPPNWRNIPGEGCSCKANESHFKMQN